VQPPKPDLKVQPYAGAPQVIKNVARQGIDYHKLVAPTGSTGCNADWGQLMADLTVTINWATATDGYVVTLTPPSATP
jgi:hypothetical protein